MREENGIDSIYEAIEKLGNVAEQSIQICEENKQRLSGKCETASWKNLAIVLVEEMLVLELVMKLNEREKDILKIVDQVVIVIFINQLVIF